MSELPNDAEAEAAAGMGSIERALSRAMLLLAGLALVLMSVLTAVDVIGRSLRMPLAAATELTEILMVVVVFCAMPVVTRRENHIVIDILDFIVPSVIRRIEAIVINLAGTVAMIAVTWRVWTLAEQSAEAGDFTAYLQLPMAPIITFVAVLTACVAAAFLANLVNAVTRQT